MKAEVGRRLEVPWTSRSTGGAILSAVLLSAGIAIVVLVGIWRGPVAERAHTSDDLAQQAGQIVADVFSASSDSWA
ncbi:MAG: hypothetical protein WAW85_04005, partial [Gordonia sp. (in: high G+C Gram-positive bacteria)]